MSKQPNTPCPSDPQAASESLRASDIGIDTDMRSVLTLYSVNTAVLPTSQPRVTQQTVLALKLHTRHTGLGVHYLQNGQRADANWYTSSFTLFLYTCERIPEQSIKYVLVHL